MTPLETTYRGCRFRSRLEARWAVFLSYVGLKWQYEPQGFIVGPDVCYLPDFWLPQRSMWLEVKPTEHVEGEDLAKITAFGNGLWEKLRREDVYQSYYVLCGTPYLDDYTVKHVVTQSKTSEIVLVDTDVRWSHCPLCDRIDMCSFYSGWNDGTEAIGCEYCDVVDRSRPDTKTAWFHKGMVETSQRGFIRSSQRLMTAYSAAVSERFVKGAGRCPN